MKNKNYIQRSSMRLSEEEQKTCFKKGINYLDQGKYEEALKIFGVLLMGESKNASLHYYKGNTLHKLKRYEEALESFKVAIGFKPWEGAYYYGLASSYYAFGNGTEGLEALQKAVSAYVSSEGIYHKHNMLAGFKREENGNQGMQLNVVTHKAIKLCSHHRQYAGLKVGDNYSFGFMR
ncbi:tetratricopeptide repeat protein [Rickettsia sp. R2]|uniref:tetratricopeptide repeat protein n=1 Tax=Rickettsia koreansis TaxID=2358204 RepID=UPI0039799191